MAYGYSKKNSVRKRTESIVSGARKTIKKAAKAKTRSSGTKASDNPPGGAAATKTGQRRQKRVMGI